MHVHEKHKKHAVKEAKFIIFVVSTSRWEALKTGKDIEEDVSGELAKEIILKSGFDVVSKEFIRDGILHVRKALNKAIRRKDVDVVIFIGGTGVSRTDQTYEVIKGIISKELTGFGELFRALSFKEIGTSAFLSRAILGLYRGKVIIGLPGSPNAIKLALEKIVLPEIGHILYISRHHK